MSFTQTGDMNAGNEWRTEELRKEEVVVCLLEINTFFLHQ